MTKIYIAGPMTGLPDLNYPAFHEAAAALRAAGHEVFNPAENPEPTCGSWNGYMRMAIAQLTQCEAIYLLPNWMRSKGARLESRIAMDFGLQRMYSQIEVDQLARMHAAIEDAKAKGARVAMVDGGPVFFSCEGDQQAKGIKAAIAEYVGAADCPACGGSGHVEDVQADTVRALLAALPATEDSSAGDLEVPDERDVEIAGLTASVGHLSSLIDWQQAALMRAKNAMSALHSAAAPINESQGDFDARIPESAFAQFVDEHAALMYAIANSPVAPPQAEVQAEPVMIYHGRCTIDCGAHGHHDVEMLKMIPAGAKLYTAPQAQPSFQQRVHPWLMECFGEMIAGDRQERNHRFLEEALELAQSCGCTASEAHQLVDYVYGRPVGEPVQEAGGVMVTLAALCLANGLDMHQAGETELARIWTKVDAIRAKQAAKPKHSPLPQDQPADALDAERWRALLACGRIRIIGTAGVNGSGIHDPSRLDTYNNPYGNYVHFGAEFWSTFPDQDYYNTKGNPAYARATLTEFADACRAAMAAAQEGGAA